MTARSNDKAAAWDLMASRFWESGPATDRPSRAEIGLFTAGIRPGDRCTVVGASTKDLIEALLAGGAEVTVLDFSERMCADLSKSLRPGSWRVRRNDITHAVPDELRGSQQFVLSDRLLNRFDDVEVARGLGGMLDLLVDAGQLRASVRLGLYPLDMRMIVKGREHGCLDDFYDAGKKVVDFVAAGDVLAECLVEHGGIEPDILLNWYRGRGREQRFDHEDVLASLASVSVRGRRLRLVSETVFDQAPNTTMYVAQAVVAVAG